MLRVRNRSKAQHTSVSLSRTNLLLRDNFSCMYCGSEKDLTIGEPSNGLRVRATGQHPKAKSVAVGPDHWGWALVVKVRCVVGWVHRLEPGCGLEHMPPCMQGSHAAFDPAVHTPLSPLADHVVPQSKGGQNTWENLVTCCGEGSHALCATRLSQVPLRAPTLALALLRCQQAAPLL